MNVIRNYNIGGCDIDDQVFGYRLTTRDIIVRRPQFIVEILGKRFPDRLRLFVFDSSLVVCSEALWVGMFENQYLDFSGWIGSSKGLTVRVVYYSSYHYDL